MLENPLPPSLPTPTTCPSCSSPIETGHRYCPRCGKRLGSEILGVFYHPWVILFLALTILGPFAIPLVVKSPRMSAPAKWLMSVLIIVYTALCLWLLWFITMYYIGHWREIAELLRGVS